MAAHYVARDFKGFGESWTERAARLANPRDDGHPESGKRPANSRVTGDLAARIAAAKRDQQIGAQAAMRDATTTTTWGRAARLGSEFIAAILVGTGLGYVLDLWLKTQPWIMLVMLLVGFAAGILNVTRSVAEMNKAAPPPPGSDLGPEPDDEDR